MEEFVDASNVISANRAAAAHAHRHDRAMLDLRPTSVACVTDYALPCVRVSRALQELDEALPSGQEVRVREAFMLLRQGVEELAVWLRARGVEV